MSSTLATQETGWFRLSHLIGTDQALYNVEDETLVLPALGLHVAALGLCQARESDFISLTEIRRSGVVPAAGRTEALAAANALCQAGFWTEDTLDGVQGFVIGGAREAIEEKQARIAKARKAANSRHHKGKDPVGGEQSEIQTADGEQPF